MCTLTACVTLLSAQSFPQAPSTAQAANSSAAKKPVVVVSLGDSYSSGEGIDPFYGENLPWDEKVNCQDWLAHRSQLSWPGLIEIPGVPGTMLDYKTTGVGGMQWYEDCKWYFAASSGAETVHIKDAVQIKEVYNKDEFGDTYLQKTIPKQLDVFDEVKDDGYTVDYVTMTIGGNDVGFVDVVIDCALGSTYLYYGTKMLDKKFDEIWDNWSYYKANIKQVYNDVYEAAGPDAHIIIAGYPKLFEQSGKGALISAGEADLVNTNVNTFNINLEEIVKECNMDLEEDHFHFVEVESAFNGHEAYSKVPWINKIHFGTYDNDLDHSAISSSYSMHPNDKGAQAYAECVNKVIEKIEEEKGTNGTAVYAIKGAEWAVDPTIEADDIIIGDKYPAYYGEYDGSYHASPYAYIERNGKYGLISIYGEIVAEPKYDRFNGEYYSPDEFIAVFDSKSGDTVYAQRGTGREGVWYTEEVKGARGAPTTTAHHTTYFINKLNNELYYYDSIEGIGKIDADSDANYIVQTLYLDEDAENNNVISPATVEDDSFCLVSADLSTRTSGYPYVYSNGSGCVNALYQTCAFSNDKKKWDLYNSDGEQIVSGLEPFDSNLYHDSWWTPASLCTWEMHGAEDDMYSEPAPFCATEGYIAAKIDGKYGYLDLDGNVVIEFGILDDVRPVHNGKAWAKFEGKWGVLSFD